MTLYDALKKADEVRRPSETRLAPATSNEIYLKMKETTPLVSHDFDTMRTLPTYLKLFRVTTARPKKAKVLAKYFYECYDSEDMHEYRCGESVIYICSVGLKHVFGKIPKTLYLSKVEKAK